MTDAIRAGDIERALAEKYSAPAFAFMPQIADGTGMNASRRSDAVAMSLWPSRGLYLVGFEIKVDRQDWMNELRNPDKAEAFAQYCRYWWLVTAPDVVHVGQAELGIFPPTWGHMVFDGHELSVRKAAPERPEKPLTIEIIAALFRGLTSSYVPASRVSELADERAKTLARRRDHVEVLKKRLAGVQRAIRLAQNAVWQAEDAIDERRPVPSEPVQP